MTGEELKRLITEIYGNEHGVVARAARGLGISAPYLHMMLSGRRQVPGKIIERFPTAPVVDEARKLVDSRVAEIASEAEVLGIPLKTVRLALRDSLSAHMREGVEA